MMTKQDILEATLELACEKGLGSISMLQIAEKVHLKKSSLYSHFKSKDDIIENMYIHFRDKAKQQRGIPEIDYDKLFAGRSFQQILLTVVDLYRQVNNKPELAKFYRLIMAERVYNPSASAILIEETRRMIAATKHLFYALSAKKVVDFKDPDAAALSFAMGVHAILDFECDAGNVDLADADGAMERYIEEFSRVYAADAPKP